MDHLLTALKALADETRFKLIQLLLTQDLCGKALARRLGISEAAVSQHLKVLKDAGLLEGKRLGYWIHYSVQRDLMEEIIQELGRLARRSAVQTGQCRRLHAGIKGHKGKEVRAMCQCCCEHPEKLKGKAEECTPEQMRDCHGDVKKHPCEGEKKEGK